MSVFLIILWYIIVICVCSFVNIRVYLYVYIYRFSAKAHNRLHLPKVEVHVLILLFFSPIFLSVGSFSAFAEQCSLSFIHEVIRMDSHNQMYTHKNIQTYNTNGTHTASPLSRLLNPSLQILSMYFQCLCLCILYGPMFQIMLCAQNFSILFANTWWLCL